MRDYHLLYAGAAQVKRTMDFEELLTDLRLGFHETVAITADSRTFLAGGVVEWRGRTVLLPGPRGSGCSTLVSALADRGAQVLSERFIVLDGEGQIHPYGDGASHRSPAEPDLVVLTEYSDKVKNLRMRALTPGQAAMHLFTQSYSARQKPDRDLPLLSKLAVKTPVVKGRRGEAEAAAQAILRKVERNAAS